MVRYQSKNQGRKLSGGRLRASSKKKKRGLSRPNTLTTIVGEKEEIRTKIVRTLGGNKKTRLYRTNVVNALDKETGKTSQATVTDVLENAASNEFRRRDIITKGSILETSAGNVKVTNKPSKEGFVNGIIIKE
jgi:small subunit ribosomal protein S8e